MQRISDRIYFTVTSDNFTLVISNALPRILKYFFIAISSITIVLLLIELFFLILVFIRMAFYIYLWELHILKEFQKMKNRNK